MTISYSTMEAKEQTKLNEVKQMTEEQIQQNEIKEEPQNVRADQTEELNKDWLIEEEASLPKGYDGEKKEYMKFEENKISEIEVDFSTPFQKWDDTENNVLKKIIPVKHEGVDKVFFCNVKNPLYSELIKLGKEGQTKFRILRTGQMKGTRYTIVQE